MQRTLDRETARNAFLEHIAGPELRRLWRSYCERLAAEGAISPDQVDRWAPPETKRAPKRP